MVTVMPVAFVHSTADRKKQLVGNNYVVDSKPWARLFKTNDIVS